MLSLKVNFYEYATKQKLRCPVNYNRISCLQLCMKNLTDFAAGSNSENLLPKPLLQSLWKSMPLLYTFRHKPHETKKKTFVQGTRTYDVLKCPRLVFWKIKTIENCFSLETFARMNLCMGLYRGYCRFYKYYYRINLPFESLFWCLVKTTNVV